MHAWKPRITLLMLVSMLAQTALVTPAAADHFWARLLRLEEEKLYAGKEPKGMCADDAMQELAMNIDWLEHHIDTYGSVVAKQPDIWGEARLTKHRDEYERILFQELNQFQFTLNAAIRQSDQSFAAAALALSNATQKTTKQPVEPKPGDVVTIQQTPMAMTVNPGDLLHNIPANTTIAPVDLTRFEGGPKLNIEPTTYLDQLSRYVNHLHELRRINEGDDTSDSPGYALDLVRIPVSVLPGKLTQEGWAAEITVTATPVLSNDLLPTTFRNLAINDLVSQLGLTLVKFAEDVPRRKAKAQQPADGDVLKALQDARTQLTCATCALLELGGFNDGINKLGRALLNLRNSTVPAVREVGDGLYARILEKMKTGPGGSHQDVTAVQVLGDTANYSPTQAAYAALARLASTSKNTQSEIDASPIQLTQLPSDAEIARMKEHFINSQEELVAEVRLGIADAEARIDSITRAPAIPASSSRGRRALEPLPPTQVVPVFGLECLQKISEDFFISYKGRNVRWAGDPESKTESRVDLLDLRHWLQDELNAAYELLSQPNNVRLWREFASVDSGLARVIRENRTASGPPPATGPSPLTPVEVLRADFFRQLNCGDAQTAQGKCCTDTVECLAWAVVVESALLNERLNEDVRRTAVAKQCYELQSAAYCHYFLPEAVMNPNNGLDDLQGEFLAAAETFQSYVRCRWPIHVFALDPGEQDQNVADVSARRRELQLALSMGFVQGEISAHTLMQYSRQLETEVETISLNQTIVAFGHGDNTFGWRFYPRVQALDQPGAAGTVWQSFRGTPREHDLRKRRLEPGMRECVAVVLMPSFVPYADFDVRSNWLRIANPKNAALTMKDTMKLSRAITAMRRSQVQCARCACCYRDGDLERMLKRVDQLDRELPLQTMRQQIPFENTLGGFQMFNTGVTDFAPELYGWYGAPGIVISDDPAGYACGCAAPCAYTTPAGDVTAIAALQVEVAKLKNAQNPNIPKETPLPTCEGKGTTVFLVGDHLSVHDTKVIAGGVCIPDVRLVSREIMRVTIPSCVSPVEVDGQKYVAVYAATPYGVTSHLHIPITASPLKKEQTDLAKSVKALQERVDQLGATVPEFTVANNQKLEFDGECAALGSSSLNFRPKIPQFIDLAFQSPYAPQNGVTIKAGVYYAGVFQGALFPVTLTPRAVADKGVYRVDLNEVVVQPGNQTIIQVIGQRLKDAQPAITKTSFKDGKAAASVFLFLSVPGCCEQRMAGAIPIEITLACDCCTLPAKAPAAATGVLPTSAAGGPAPGEPVVPADPTPGAPPAPAGGAGSESLPAGVVNPAGSAAPDAAPTLAPPAPTAPGCNCSAELESELIVR
jgi:hypothetical protein